MTPAMMPGVATVLSAALQLPALPAPEAEVERPDNPVVFIPRVSEERSITYMPAGLTLAEMLGADAAHSLRVTIGGELVPRVIWAQVKPKPGVPVHVEFWPQGGGARKWILTIVAIVATVFTMGAAAGASWALVAGLSATTVMVGGAVIAALALAMIPPPVPKLGAGAGASDPLNQLQSLTGTSNQIAPYGAIPIVLGDWTLHPPHAALPYTEISGSDQYMRMLLDLGLGNLDVSDVQIGGTPIDSYDNVEWEVTETPTLYTQDVFELNVGTSLANAGDSDTRTTQTQSTEISLDLVFPSGLYGRDTQGKTTQGTCGFTIQYAPAGSGAWVSAAGASGLTTTGGISASGGSFTVSSSKADALRLGVRWKVTAGQYDVRVTRGTATFPGAASGATSGDASWYVLRSINPQNPSTTDTLKLAVRIKATGQLQGVVSTLTARIGQKIRQWDTATQSFTLAQATSNPAWIYLWLLTECPAATIHVSTAQVDLDGIAEWAAWCDSMGLVYAGVADSQRPLGDVIKDVLACGLATFGIRNGKYGVVRDIAQTVPMQVYTPINQTSIQWTRNFADPPHALRVSFTNPEVDGQQDEMLVYWNGYDKTNATRIEQLDLRNVTDPAAVWRIARYHLAVMWLRPNTYVQDTDIEHLVSERGDLVELSGPLIGWGVGAGRIKTIVGSVVTLDQGFQVVSGKSYAVRVRFDTAYSSTSNITIAASDIENGVAYRFTLSSAIADIDAGQLIVVGEVNNVTLPVIITGIQPSDSMLERNATLTCVDADPGVWSSFLGTPPPFVSSINGKFWCAAPDPPQLNLVVTGSTNDSGAFNQAGSVSIPPQGGVLRGGGGGGSASGRNGTGIRVF